MRLLPLPLFRQRKVLCLLREHTISLLLLNAINPKSKMLLNKISPRCPTFQGLKFNNRAVRTNRAECFVRWHQKMSRKRKLQSLKPKLKSRRANQMMKLIARAAAVLEKRYSCLEQHVLWLQVPFSSSRKTISKSTKYSKVSKKLSKIKCNRSEDCEGHSNYQI